MDKSDFESGGEGSITQPRTGAAAAESDSDNTDPDVNDGWKSEDDNRFRFVLANFEFGIET